MTKVSRKPLEPKVKRKIIRDFWRGVSYLNKPAETEPFLRRLLTPTEIIMLAKRLALLKELRQKPSYAELKEKYKVTDVTIAKMANILHTAEEFFLKILDNLP